MNTFEVYVNGELHNSANVRSLYDAFRRFGFKPGRAMHNLQLNGVHTFKRGTNKGVELRYVKAHTEQQRPQQTYIITRNGETTAVNVTTKQDLREHGFSSYAINKLSKTGEFIYKRGTKAGISIRRSNEIDWIIAALNSTYADGVKRSVDIRGNIDQKDIITAIYRTQQENFYERRIVVKLVLESNEGERRTLYITLFGDNYISMLNDVLNGTLSPESAGSDVEIYHTFNNVIKVTFMDASTALNKRSSNKKYKSRTGGFFPYYNPIKKFSLERQQIFHKDQYNEMVAMENCLIYALEQSGLFTLAEMEDMRISIVTKNATMSTLSTFAKKYNFAATVTLRPNGQTYTKTINKSKKNERHILLGLLEKHWFINDKNVENGYISYIKHFDKLDCIKHDGQNKYRRDRGGRWVHDNKAKTYKPFRIIREMLAANLFEPMEGRRLERAGQYKPSDDVRTLEYDESRLKPLEFDEKKPEFIEYRRENGKKVKIIIPANIYYADFETTTSGKFSAFAVSVSDESGENTYDYYGEHPAIKLLEFVKHNSYVGFHNLSFDFNFIVSYCTIINIMKNGNKIKRATLIYKNKKIVVFDTYLYLPTKLANFSSMFNIPVEKEIFPYDWFSNVNAFSGRSVYPIDSLKDYIKPVDWEEFKNNPLNKRGFDKVKYTKYYCHRDVEVLRLGMNSFREQIRTVTGLDLLGYVSLASLAHGYLTKEKCYDGVYKLQGAPRQFIQQAILGGRVMTNRNKKIRITGKNILDFDAVSLYPSGMMTLPTVLVGKPHVLSDEQIAEMNRTQNPRGEFTETFIEYTIDTIKHDLDFPLIFERGESINYVNKTGIKLITSGRYLDEIIKYHGATFTVNRGYYFNDGYNEQIRTTMRTLFNKRLEMKAAKNSLQLVYKLIMNSSYGIHGLKQIMKRTVFKTDDGDALDYMQKNYDIIESYTRIRRENTHDTIAFTVRNVKSVHTNTVHIGASILDASKIIMNRVFDMVNRIGVSIYYQDTDSLQTDAENIPKIAEQYKKVYGEELIGTQPAQFHPDYELRGAIDVVGTRAIFLAKKVYYVELSGKSDDGIVNGHHIRMKGVPEDAVISEGKPWDVYSRLYDGETITFDLARHKLRLKINDYTVRKMRKFTRDVHINAETSPLSD